MIFNKELKFVLIIFLSVCSCTQEENLRNTEDLKLNMNSSDHKKGSCLNNCFFPELNYNFIEPMDFGSTLSEGFLQLFWNYNNSTAALDPQYCNINVFIQFRSTAGITSWQQTIYSNTTENFSIDITNEFISSTNSSVLIYVPPYSNSPHYSVYEVRLIVNATCSNSLSCCYESDWNIVTTYLMP